jgi:type IV secretion system protein VirB4
MLKNKFSENKLKFSDIDSDFIPYAAHFSEDTLITKSGNLMQVIKITGFAYEVYEKKHLSIRASIRAAIKNHINNDSFAIWTHTIRRRKDLSLKGE